MVLSGGADGKSKPVLFRGFCPLFAHRHSHQEKKKPSFSGPFWLRDLITCCKIKNQRKEAESGGRAEGLGWDVDTLHIEVRK